MTEQKKIAFITLGCKVNQFESSWYAQELKTAGFIPVDKNTTADIYIINTCTVTSRAAYQSRNAIYKAIKKNPGAKIWVTGCYAQEAPEIAAGIHGVSGVIGTHYKHKIPDIVLKGTDLLKPLWTEARDETAFLDMEIHSKVDRTRPQLKVQDGCNAFCSYCIVPYVRGKSRSLPLEKVTKQAHHYIEMGYSEIVITGIHLGLYGHDLEPGLNLFKLLKALNNLPGTARFRLSSLEPAEVTDEIIQLFSSSSRFCSHLHIPLQSGSHDILKKMGRSYNTSYYGDLIWQLREMFPEMGIGADVLIGSCGENTDTCQETYDFIKKIPLTYLHVFPYSKRNFTDTASCGTSNNKIDIKKWSAKIRGLGEIKKRAFMKSQKGLIREVIIEKQNSDFYFGLTDNYLPVKIQKHNEISGNLLMIKITGMEDSFLTGVIGSN